MKSGLSWVLAAAIVSSVSGCRSIFGSDQAVILHVTELNAPATVDPGSSFSVVLTVQTGGCRRFDYIDTDKSQSGANITVWGRDSGAGRNVACPTDIRFESHTVVLDPPFASSFVITVGRGALSPLTATVTIQ